MALWNLNGRTELLACLGLSLSALSGCSAAEDGVEFTPITNTGGSTASGGVVATGGLASGGELATGGVVATGGAATGGDIATGGMTTGGDVGTGGMATGGDATTGGMATGGDLTTGGEMPDAGHVASCADDIGDVVMLGDSYVDWITHTFIQDMRTEAGQEWPEFATGGFAMANGGLGKIPDEFYEAIAAYPNIHTIVMTGGGNDILVADTAKFPDAGRCTREPNAQTIPDCAQIVQEAVDRAEEMMMETADMGVRNIIYFFYPHIPGGGLISGAYPDDLLDYALEKARPACENALEKTNGRLQCHFVDMVPVFEGKTGLFSNWTGEDGDGVHPNSMGSKLMAKEIWRVMTEHCIGQPSSSGCCLQD